MYNVQMWDMSKKDFWSESILSMLYKCRTHNTHNSRKHNHFIAKYVYTAFHMDTFSFLSKSWNEKCLIYSTWYYFKGRMNRETIGNRVTKGQPCQRAQQWRWPSHLRSCNEDSAIRVVRLEILHHCDVFIWCTCRDCQQFTQRLNDAEIIPQSINTISN